MAKWPYNQTEWLRLRREILGAGGVRCQVTPGCRREATSLDHFPVPVQWIRDGRFPAELAFSRDNVRPACKRCNDAAGGRLAGARSRRRRGVGGRKVSREW